MQRVRPRGPDAATTQLPQCSSLGDVRNPPISAVAVLLIIIFLFYEISYVAHRVGPLNAAPRNWAIVVIRNSSPIRYPSAGETRSQGPVTRGFPISRGL